MKIVAWDPGKQGATASIDTETMEIGIVSLRKIKSRTELLSVLEATLTNCDVFVYEEQTFYVGVHVAANTMGVFGRQMGFVEGAVAMLRHLKKLTFIARSISAAEWMKSVKIERPVKEKRLKWNPKKMSPEEKVRVEMENREINKRNSSIKLQWKRMLIEEARRLYPSIKITNDNADALLLLRYAIETYGSGNR